MSLISLLVSFLRFSERTLSLFTSLLKVHIYTPGGVHAGPVPTMTVCTCRVCTGEGYLPRVCRGAYIHREAYHQGIQGGISHQGTQGGIPPRVPGRYNPG